MSGVQDDRAGRIYIPVTSMIIVSVLLTLVINLFFRRWPSPVTGTITAALAQIRHDRNRTLHTMKIMLNRFIRSCLVAVILMVPIIGAAAGEKTGGWRLALESSPYLRLHADNPVEWFPWGEEAFAKARRENKPVFISVGYFTCHWCHVMARESFSNPRIAALLNAGFVSIKVDREQRPDVDAAYMNYVMATSGQGGWPMSVWATPEGHPFMGGTYYPPEPGLGRPGMSQILATLDELWRETPERLRESAQNAVALLREMGSSATPLSRLTDEFPALARKQFAADYDEFHGGFGTAPKFPQPARLLFLLQSGDQTSVDRALHTLDKMAAGGIYDQLEGGIHRYSTDFEWRVPHFEKMLYDQALVARAYLVAYRETRDERYAGVAREILDFSLEQLHDEEGGFYSALSADSHVDDERSGHMEEGVYYTWTWQQLTEALGEGALRDWAAARYGMTQQGNALSDPLGEMAGRNVSYLALDSAALARQFKLDLISAGKRNAEVRQRLIRARRERPPVPVDDKVVTEWNGYMITTLAMAGRLLDEPRYVEAATATAVFVMDELYDDEHGVLYRDWRSGERGVPGFSDDYAALAQALVSLFKVTGEKARLHQARRLVDSQLAAFWDADNGGFYRSPADTELWLREKEASDGATLSVNGVAVHTLLDLGRLTGNRDYTGKAFKTAAWAAAQLQEAPHAMPYLLIRWPELMAKPVVEVKD
jgi:uncharacterized protein YyaL (SSP411 family)